MKKILSLAALVLALLVSCTAEYEPKEIECTAREFTGGELSKLVEVSVFDEGELTFSETDGAIPKQTIMLKLKLKLKKERPDLKEVDAQDIHFTGLLSVAIVKVEDKNGAEVLSLNIKDSDVLKLKKLLQGKEDDEEYIVFMGEYHNSKDAPKWFESAAQYTPDFTADITVGEKEVTKSKPSRKESAETDDDDDLDLSSSAEGDSSIDEFLDEYEEFRDQYIKTVKKIDKNDPTAMIEYAKLLKESNEYQKKLQKMKGRMSLDQIQRMNEISLKFAKAAQEMN